MDGITVYNVKVLADKKLTENYHPNLQLDSSFFSVSDLFVWILQLSCFGSD